MKLRIFILFGIICCLSCTIFGKRYYYSTKNNKDAIPCVDCELFNNKKDGVFFQIDTSKIYICSENACNKTISIGPIIPIIPFEIFSKCKIINSELTIGIDDPKYIEMDRKDTIELIIEKICMKSKNTFKIVTDENYNKGYIYYPNDTINVKIKIFKNNKAYIKLDTFESFELYVKDNKNRKYKFNFKPENGYYLALFVNY